MIRRDSVRFARLVESLLSAGRAVRFRAEGDSMAPAIGDGDVVTVAPVGEPAPGDVLLCRTGDRLVLHRLIGVDTSGRAVRFILRGDAARRPDPPVDKDDVLGRVVAVRRRRAARLIRRRLGWARRLARRVAGGG